MTAHPDPEALDAADAEDGGNVCQLHLPGWAGSLSELLEQVRAERVDWAPLSAAALVEQLEAQLLAAIAAKTTPLPQLAHWVVTAATLLALRARLLVPTTPAEEAAVARDTARQHLQEREAIQRAATWLEQRPQLGRDVFARGVPEPLADAPPAADLTELLRACLTLLAAPIRSDTVYRPNIPPLWRVPQAMAHLRRVLPGLAGEGALLAQLVPTRGEHTTTPLQQRAALASTLMAGLELSRDGALSLEQHDAFGPIQVEPAGTRSAADTAAVTEAGRARERGHPGHSGAGS